MTEKWVFTLHKPSMIPFLQYSQNRTLREKIYLGYINRGNHDDELDNKKILAEMAALRVERAKLLGYRDARALRAGREHGQSPRQRLQTAQRSVATRPQESQQEVADMQQMIDDENGGFPARIVGLVVLRREGEEGEVRPGRRNAPPLLQAGERPARRLRRGRRDSMACDSRNSATISLSITKTSRRSK